MPLFDEGFKFQVLVSLNCQSIIPKKINKDKTVYERDGNGKIRQTSNAKTTWSDMYRSAQWNLLSFSFSI